MNAGRDGVCSLLGTHSPNRSSGLPFCHTVSREDSHSHALGMFGCSTWPLLACFRDHEERLHRVQAVGRPVEDYLGRTGARLLSGCRDPRFCLRCPIRRQRDQVAGRHFRMTLRRRSPNRVISVRSSTTHRIGSSDLHPGTAGFHTMAGSKTEAGSSTNGTYNGRSRVDEVQS